MSKIIGIPVGTTLPKPNWNQTDPTKGDYINNKPLTPTDAEILELLTETGIICPVCNSTGDIFVDNNNKVYIL